MNNKHYPSSQPAQNKWGRLGFSITLALSLAFIFLLLPVTANSIVIRVALPYQTEPVNLALPLGAALVQATNGLTLTKTAPLTVNQGAVLTYTLTLANETGEDLTWAQVTDTVPANTTCLRTYSSLSPPNPLWTHNCNPTIRWDMVYYPPYLPYVFTDGTTNILTFSVTVDQPLPDLHKIVNNDYRISASSGTTPYEHIGDPFTTTVYAPNLIISKTVSSETIQPGETLTYTLTVTNIGHLATSGDYTVVDPLPNATDPGSVWIDPQAPGTSNGAQITWVFSDPLPALGGSQTMTYSIRVNNPLTDNQSIVNKNYTVSGGNVYTPTTTGDPITVTVNTPITLHIVKTAPATVQAGDLLTYTLAISHNAVSTGPAFGLVVTDVIPANTTLENAGFGGTASGTTASNGSVVTWTITSPNPLPFTEMVTLTMAVRTDTPLTNGTVITNNAYSVAVTNTLATVLPGPVVTTTIQSAPALTVTKQGLPQQVTAGGQITYTIQYTNTGNANATGVLVRDIFPISTTYAGHSSAPDIGSGSSIPTGMEWIAPFVAGEGGSGVITLTLNVEQPQPSGTVLTNVVAVRSSEVITPAVFTTTNQVTSSPVLTISKQGLPVEVAAGGLLTYTIRYTNTGNADATGVLITDIFPLNTTYVSDSSTPNLGSGSSISGGMVWTSANLSGLGGAGVITLTLTVTTPQPSGTVLTNVVSISSAEIVEPVGFTATNQITSTPALTISKQGRPFEVAAGGLLTYTIRYTNTGNADATGVVIRDIFPLNTTYAGNSSTPNLGSGTSIPGGREWTAPNVPGINGGGIITLTLNVDQPQPSGTILTNTVSIFANQVSNPAIFTATNQITSTPQLHIHKLAQPSPVAIGAVLTYTLIYSNSGNADAVGVAITDVLDNNVSFSAAGGGGTHSNGIVTWTGLTVPADSVDRQLLITVTVAPTLSNGTLLNNQFEISNGTSGAAGAINTVVFAPELRVSKTISPSTGIVRAGENVAYTIIYTNTGPIAASNVFITDTFPVSITNIISTSTEAVFQTAAPPDYVWFDATVPPGSGGIITITGTVITSWSSSGGLIDNQVLAAGDAYSDTAFVSVEGRPGLPYIITLVADPDTTQVGGTIHLTATVTDVYGNQVYNGTAVLFSTNPTLGTMSPSPMAGTLNGIANVSLLSTQAGSTTVQARIQELGMPVPLTQTTVVTFTPGPFVGFTIEPDPVPDQIAGVSFPLTITAVDAFGNPVTTFNNTAAITDTTQTIVPTLVTFVDGVAVANVTVYSATSPNLDTITVTYGITTGTTSVKILPHNPANLFVTVDPLVLRICETANVTATLTDQWLNPISNRPVTLTGFGPVTFLGPTTGTTNPAGIFSSVIRGSGTGGTAIVRAASAGLSTNSADIEVNGSALPSAITVTVNPPSAPAGSSATVTAQVSSCQGPVNNTVVTFTVGSLAAITPPGTATTNSSGVATIPVTAGAILGTTTITGTVEGPLSGSTPFTITLAAPPALSITKTANPAPGTVSPGGSIIYTVVVANTGTGPANNVRITDTLNTNLNFVNQSITSGSGSYNSGTRTVSFTVASLAAGAAVTATIETAVSTSVVSGTTISNTAAAGSSETGPIGPSSPVVTHQVITRTVGPVYLPLILKNYPQPPDLIASFSLNPPNPAAGQNVVVTVVVTNVGSASTGSGFWVDFYVEPNPVPTQANQRWDVLGSNVSPKQGIAWSSATALAPGDSIVLTSNGVGGLAPSEPHTIWNGVFYSGTNDLYVYVDSFSTNGSPSGGILESDETNNRSQLTGLGITGLDANTADLTTPIQLPPRWDP